MLEQVELVLQHLDVVEEVVGLLLVILLGQMEEEVVGHLLVLQVVPQVVLQVVLLL